MPFRIATFLIASALAAGLAKWFFGWSFVGWGAWVGALAWLALDAWRANRLLDVLRQGGAGLQSRGAGYRLTLQGAAASNSQAQAQAA